MVLLKTGSPTAHMQLRNAHKAEEDLHENALRFSTWRMDGRVGVVRGRVDTATERPGSPSNSIVRALPK